MTLRFGTVCCAEMNLQRKQFASSFFAKSFQLRLWRQRIAGASAIDRTNLLDEEISMPNAEHDPGQ
jgi:hypothetical protein